MAAINAVKNQRFNLLSQNGVFYVYTGFFWYAESISGVIFAF